MAESENVGTEVVDDVTVEVEDTQDGRKRVNVSAERFIAEHEKHNSYAELSATLGIKETTCQLRANKYRKLGIPLKNYPRSSATRLDVAAANALLSKLRQAEQSDSESSEEGETNTEG